MDLQEPKAASRTGRAAHGSPYPDADYCDAAWSAGLASLAFAGAGTNFETR